MKSQKIIKFIYGKGSPKCPKQLQNSVFVLYSSERIKLQPGEFKHVNMKVAVRMPEEIVAVGILLPTLSKNGLKLENSQNISADNNICNANQPVNLPWKIHFDLVNRSTSGAIFTIFKNQELMFLTTLNEGMEKLKVKYMKST